MRNCSPFLLNNTSYKVDHKEQTTTPNPVPSTKCYTDGRDPQSLKYNKVKTRISVPNINVIVVLNRFQRISLLPFNSVA